ncbi:hypothetical protein BKA70DRAFT_1396759 [Coprinopsis sp. MPI-PUGE-AT-0042]|nr:hypothetical protein BKA70DRAFT_1396759 [Coprinopsis sp. MPI-PUGE-AT-0042]
MGGPIRQQSATARHQEEGGTIDSPFAPHHPDSVAAGLTASAPKGARALAQEYEDFALAKPLTRTFSLSPSRPSPKRVPPPSRYTEPTVSPSASKIKDKSPLRHSFRNILSLLKEKKGKFTSGDLKPVLRPSPSSKSATTKLHKDLPLLPAAPASAEGSSPSRGQSGTLIYLISKHAAAASGSPIPASPGAPIWTTSSILLNHGKITVSWFAEDATSSSMVPRVHEISLVGCTDIRSITPDALDPKSIQAFSSWRPDDPSGIGGGEGTPLDDLKIFEILFERRPREVFAVRNVRERAKWISVLWDAVLAAGSSKGAEERGRTGKGVALTRGVRWKKARFSNLPSDDEGDDDARSPSPLSMRYRGKHLSAPAATTIIGASMDAIPPVLTKRDRSLPPLPPSHLRDSALANVDHAGVYGSLNTSPPDEPEAEGTQPTVEMSRTANLSTKSDKSVYSIPDLPMPVKLQPQLQSRSRSGSGTRHLRVKNNVSSPQGSAFSYTSIYSSSTGATASTGTPRPTTAPKRYSSPSVANLSSLSVVKQRLAAIERNASQESVSLGRPGSHSGFSSPDAHRRSRFMSPNSSSLSRSSTPNLMGGNSRSRISPLVFGLNRTRSGTAASSQSGETRREGTTLVSGLPATVDEKLPPGITAGAAEALASTSPTTPASSPGARDSNAIHVKKGKEKALYEGLQVPKRSAASDDPTLPDARTELEEIARGVRGIKSVLGGALTAADHADGNSSSGQPTVHQIALGLDHRLSGANDILKEVKERLERMERRIVSTSGGDDKQRKSSKESSRENNNAARLPIVKRAGSGGGSRIPLKRAGSGSSSTSTTPLARNGGQDATEVRELLREIKGHLDSELPALSDKISELNSARDLKGGTVEGDDVTRGLKGKREPDGSRRIVSLITPCHLDVEWIPLREKLEELLTVVGAGREEVGIANQELREEVTAIVSILEDDVGHRERQAVQQADSVRYLNELNKWLETFVNNGTSQIQALAENIDTLCTEMGVTSSTISMSGEEKPQAGSAAPGNTNLLSNVRQLVLGMKARDTNMASLQASVNDLVALLSAETRIDSLTLVRMLEVQKQNQEAMLRAFSNEISGEIKGERLRFVEAMKEATAINVHQHVEQFRKELSREVHNQSKELERLQQEKQDIEHQIADLFTFHSKHKAALGRASIAVPDTRLVNPYLARSRTEGKPSKAANALPINVAKASSARSHRQVYGDHNYYKLAPGGPLPYPMEPY